MGLFGSKKKKVVRLKDSGTPLVRYEKSFRHAVDGFFYAVKEEHNMIIILLAALVAVLAGVLFRINQYEWLFCILVIGLVIAFEMVNTAIEATIDLAMPKIHPLARIAKDTASTATLVLSITAFIGACVIFIPKIVSFLH